MSAAPKKIKVVKDLVGVGGSDDGQNPSGSSAGTITTPSTSSGPASSLPVPMTGAVNVITSARRGRSDYCKCSGVVLSKALSQVLGGRKTMMRHRVHMKMRKYLIDNNLMDTSNHAKANKALEPIFGKKKFSAKKMFPHLKKHMECGTKKECAFCKKL